MFDMDEQEQPPAGAFELEKDASVNNAVVGAVRARDVNLTNSVAGLATVSGNLSISNGGCGPVLTKGEVKIRNGGCGPLIAGGDVSIQNGGTQSIIAAGGATIGQKAFVGLVVSPRVIIEDGGSVLMTSRQALAFAATAGIVSMLIWRVVGGRTIKRRPEG